VRLYRLFDMSVVSTNFALGRSKRLWIPVRLTGNREKFFGGGVVSGVSFAGEGHVLRGVVVRKGMDAGLYKNSPVIRRSSAILFDTK